MGELPTPFENAHSILDLWHLYGIALKEFEKELHKNDMSVVQKGTVELYIAILHYSLRWNMWDALFLRRKRIPFASSLLE